MSQPNILPKVHRKNDPENTMKELIGKTVLITGASKGIGEATALRMAERGMNVVLVARSENAIIALAQKIVSNGGKAIAVACDVADYSQVRKAVQAGKSEFGSIDIIVNNAGLIEPIAKLAESDPDGWSQVIDVNVKGVYHTVRATLPAMLERGQGVIINISSGAATSVLDGWSHYCSSKAAVLSLTRGIHKEVSDHGVRVVGLSPGTVATDMQVAIKASGINPVSQLDPSVHIPADWVAQAICWLATDDAKEFDGDDVSLRDETIRTRVGLV